MKSISFISSSALYSAYRFDIFQLFVTKTLRCLDSFLILLMYSSSVEVSVKSALESVSLSFDSWFLCRGIIIFFLLGLLFFVDHGCCCSEHAMDLFSLTGFLSFKKWRCKSWGQTYALRQILHWLIVDKGDFIDCRIWNNLISNSQLPMYLMQLHLGNSSSDRSPVVNVLMSMHRICWFESYSN